MDASKIPSLSQMDKFFGLLGSVPYRTYSVHINGTLLSGITRRATCVQPHIGSLNPAIHNAYHTSLTASSLFEPRQKMTMNMTHSEHLEIDDNTSGQTVSGLDVT